MDEEKSLYSEAVECLENTLREGQKTANVDIQMIFHDINRCCNVVQQLMSLENDPFYLDILFNLEASLQSQSKILQAKIDQLNGKKKSTDLSKVDTQKQSRTYAIEDTIISKLGIKFKDVAGLSDAKQALKEAIIMPLQFPQLFTGGIKPWKRILLYGPPGTGKSRLAQAVSSEINSTFYSVSSSDLVSSWVGESEKLIKELFSHATNQEGRSVIFIDEIDSICRQRNSREEEYSRRIKTELLKQMEGADNSDTSDKIFLLCATNCPWELDSAFLRRFQKRIYIPLPDKQTRIELMKIHTSDNKVDLKAKEWSILGDHTEGYSGSDIANLILEALFCPIRDIQSATHWIQTDDGTFVPCLNTEPSAIKAQITDIAADKITTRGVTLNDFLSSIETHRQTVTPTELRKFKDFTKILGETG